MQEQLAQIIRDKNKKTYNLDTLCPFPFDKTLDMPPFPKGVEFPKYEKYFGTSNPQEHLREFCSFSMNLWKIRHILCIYSHEIQEVRAWNGFDGFLLVSKYLIRILTFLFNNTHTTYNIQLRYVTCVTSNRMLGNISLHSFRDGNNYQIFMKDS